MVYGRLNGGGSFFGDSENVFSVGQEAEVVAEEVGYYSMGFFAGDESLFGDDIEGDDLFGETGSLLGLDASPREIVEVSNKYNSVKARFDQLPEAFRALINPDSKYGASISRRVNDLLGGRLSDSSFTRLKNQLALWEADVVKAELQAAEGKAPPAEVVTQEVIKTVEKEYPKWPFIVGGVAIVGLLGYIMLKD